MRYRNPHPHTAVLPEHRTPDGQVLDTVAVEPGDELDWPVPIASFEPIGGQRAGTTPKKAVAVSVSGETKTKGGTGEGA